jgi:hypothetical protein
MLSAMRTTREGKDKGRAMHLVGAAETPRCLYASRSMRRYVAITSISCLWLGLLAAGYSTLGCAGRQQPPATGANPPRPPDQAEVVRARKGVTGPVFQLQDGLAPESAAPLETAPGAGESADSEDEQPASE